MRIIKDSIYKKYKDMPNLEKDRIAKKVDNGIIFICSVALIMSLSGIKLNASNDINNPNIEAQQVTEQTEEKKGMSLKEFMSQADFFKVIMSDNIRQEELPEASITPRPESLVGTPKEEVIEEPKEESSQVTNQEMYDFFHKYCGYYALDTDKVYALAISLTDNFKDEQFLKDYVIGDTTFYMNRYTYTSLEAGVIAFIRDLSLEPEKFGISLNEYSTGVYEECTTYECLVGEVADLCKIDKNEVLAIMYLETGRFTSNAFMNYNNPAGIMLSTGLKRFPSKEQGIIEATFNLELNYYRDNPNITLDEMGLKYCPPGPDNGTGENYMWPKLVKQIKNEIINDPSIFIEGERKSY